MFLDKLASLEQRVSSLGIDLNNTDHPLVSRLDAARERHNSGDKTLGRVNACYVQFILEDLALIKNSDGDLYKHFTKLLQQKDLPLDNYFGLRCEIRTAASLIYKNVNFEKSETPDFIINSPLFGIECSSAHLQVGVEKPPKEVFYKVLSVLNEKGIKNYSTSETVLVLDVSNLLYQEGRNISLSVLADMDKAKPRLKSVVNGSRLSSLIYFYYRWTPKDDEQQETGVTLTNSYVRVDNSNISTPVRVFLNRFFPIGDCWIEANVGKFV